MFFCFICSLFIYVTSYADIRKHFFYHAYKDCLKYPLICNNNSCTSTFTTIHNFLRHIQTFHANVIDVDHCHEHMAFSNNEVCNTQREMFGHLNPEDNSVVGEHSDLLHGSESLEELTDVEKEVFSLVAQLRSNSSIPYYVIPNVVEACQNISETLIRRIQLQIDGFCNAEGLSEEVKEQLLNICKPNNNPFPGLKSNHNIDKTFTSHPMFVNPEQCVIGVRYEKHFRNGKFTNDLVYDTFSYVSIRKTISSYLKNKDFFELVKKNVVPNRDYINHFRDGNWMRKNIDSLDGDVNFLIELFYDGMSVTNPLRGKTAIHNVGVFYYTFKNLNSKNNSSFPNVHLLALCTSNDIKKYGFDPVLDKFCDELKILENEGILFTATDKIYKIKAFLCQVTCDNLALNSIFGMIESFSGDYFCPICYTTRCEMQQHFSEDAFHLRNKKEYEQDYETLKQTKTPIRGIKSRCKLNNAKLFHVTENYSNDAMHTLFEGIVPLELGCILYHFICTERLLSLSEFNNLLRMFFSNSIVERKNKPLELNKLNPLGEGLSPSMTATQLWCLVRFLPVFMGHLVPSESHVWELLLHLNELIEISMAPKFTTGMLAYLKDLVSSHIEQFHFLFPSVTIKPKHHFTTHFHRVIKETGPLCASTCFKYELKNSFFKRSSHIVCNFKNICHTLAYRHQHQALYNLLSGKVVRDCTIPGKCRQESVASFTYSETLKLYMQKENLETVVVTNHVNISGTKYQKSTYVVNGINAEGIPIFVKIHNFVLHEKNWVVVGETFENASFRHHFFSYFVSKEGTKFSILRLENIVDPRPLDGHHYENGILIRMKYKVLE